MRHYGHLEALAAGSDPWSVDRSRRVPTRIPRRDRFQGSADDQRRGRIKEVTAPCSSPVGDAYDLRHPQHSTPRRAS